MMPEMDGFETCQRLKSDERTKDIPIIFLSAQDDIETILSGLSSGANDYLKKPFHPKELIARIKSHLQKKYFSDGQIIDIVSVISMFGFLNRWNDTLGTKLEDVPKDFVEEKLKPLGWS